MSKSSDSDKFSSKNPALEELEDLILKSNSEIYDGMSESKKEELIDSL